MHNMLIQFLKDIQYMESLNEPLTGDASQIATRLADCEKGGSACLEGWLAEACASVAAHREPRLDDDAPCAWVPPAVICAALSPP